MLAVFCLLLLVLWPLLCKAKQKGKVRVESVRRMGIEECWDLLINGYQHFDSFFFLGIYAISLNCWC